MATDIYNLKPNEKFHGCPNEDALSHATMLEDKMEAPGFPDPTANPDLFNAAVRRLFRISLLGNARQWYKRIEFDYPNWVDLKEIFLNTYNGVGETISDFEQAWSNLRLEPGERINDFVLRLTRIADRLRKDENSRLYYFKMALPTQIRTPILAIDNFEHAIRVVKEVVGMRKQSQRSTDMGYAPINSIDLDEYTTEELASMVKKANPKEQKESKVSSTEIYRIINRLEKLEAALNAKPQAKRSLANVKCFQCNKMGHFKRDCPEFKKQQSEVVSYLQAKLSQMQEASESMNAVDDMTTEDLQAMMTLEDPDDIAQALNQLQA